MTDFTFAPEIEDTEPLRAVLKEPTLAEKARAHRARVALDVARQEALVREARMARAFACFDQGEDPCAD